MKYLLDTCIISEMVKEHPSPAVVGWLGQVEEDELALCVLTLGEIHKGIVRLPSSKRRSALETWLARDVRERFAERMLPLGLDACVAWGAMAATVEKAGRPLAVLDGLIAAVAMVNHLVVVTRNARDFEPTGVPVLNPWVAR